jgi:hypothetical protein
MIDKATAMETVMRRLEKLPVGHGLDLRTYKRNRSVIIARVGEDAFEIIESGYADQRHQPTTATMKKALKAILRREFPRSTKIRVYDLGPDWTGEPARRKTL